MHDSIQLPEIAPFRAISAGPAGGISGIVLIAVLQVGGPDSSAGRITFPLLLLTGALLPANRGVRSGTWTKPQHGHGTEPSHGDAAAFRQGASSGDTPLLVVT